MLFNEENVKDDKEAVYWYKKSYAQGNRRGTYNLARL